MNLNKLVSDAVMELIYFHTMIAQIVMSCGGVIITEENRFPAMAWTDGKGIYINKKYIDEKYPNITMKELMFIIAHEALHLMLLSKEREGNRIRYIWNMATDYVINLLLVSVERVGQIPEGALIDGQYTDMSAEQVYDKLLKNMDSQSSLSGANGSEASDESVRNDCQAQKEATGKEVAIDAHPVINDDTTESVKLRMDDIIKSFSKNSELGKRLVSIRPLPKFQWRKVLNRYIKGFIKSYSTWKLPSKRGLALGLYLPRVHVTPCINIAIAVDTSGSITNDTLDKLLSHVVKISKSFKQFNIELFCFSTEVHENTIVKLNKNTIHKFKIDEYHLTTKYGTDIESAFNYIQNSDSKFDVFICMTDGCDYISNIKFDKTNVVWAIVDDKLHLFKSPEGVKNATVIFMED